MRLSLFSDNANAINAVPTPVKLCALFVTQSYKESEAANWINRFNVI